MRILLLISGICVALSYAPKALGVEISGHIHIIGAPGKSDSPPIVYAESLDGRTPVKPGRFELTQRDKMFHPQILAIPAGSTVTFPNDDPIFHNVFSLSPPAPFDLGLYRAGSSKTLLFSQPASYRVFCNIHPQMTAVILVLPTSWIAPVDPSGNYRMDLPPGHYRLTVWSERSSPVVVNVDCEAERLTVPEVAVDESKFVEAPHKNKFGQDYPSASYGPLKRP